MDFFEPGPLQWRQMSWDSESFCEACGVDLEVSILQQSHWTDFFHVSLITLLR